MYLNTAPNITMYLNLHVNFSIVLPDFNQLWDFSRQIFVNATNIKFHGNTSSGSDYANALKRIAKRRDVNQFKRMRNYFLGCCDSLRAGWSEDRIPAGVRFSAPVQTGPGAHSASYTKGTLSFPVVKRPGRGVDHPPPSSADVKERVEL